MESLSHHDLVALLEWQAELGAVDTLGEQPVDWFGNLSNTRPIDEWFPKPGQHKPALPLPGQTAPVVHPGPAPDTDAVAVAQAAAAAAMDLESLRAAIAGFGHCELQRGARSLVFADGQPNARVMVIGEAPGADEDRDGLPFVGRAGQLLDRMFAAIGMGRTHPDATKALYITNILPWRPPQNRDPSPDEVAMMLPFVERHIALVAPDVLVLMGNHACQALLGRKGITRLRGTWSTALGKPALPMFHPAYLLRNPAAKREAWADLLALQARLAQG